MRRRRSLAYATILGILAALPIGCSQAPPPPDAGKPAEKKPLQMEIPNKKGTGTKTRTRNMPNL